jgi:hypothetical protein
MGSGIHDLPNIEIHVSHHEDLHPWGPENHGLQTAGGRAAHGVVYRPTLPRGMPSGTALAARRREDWWD